MPLISPPPCKRARTSSEDDANSKGLDAGSNGLAEEKKEEEAEEAEEDEDEEEYRRCDELDMLVYMHSSLDTPENDAIEAIHGRGVFNNDGELTNIPHSRNISRDRHKWCCAEDWRTRTLVGHEGRCEHASNCWHYPLPDEHTNAIEAATRGYYDYDLKEEDCNVRGYWKEREAGQVKEDKLRSESVTVPIKSLVLVPPPPSQPGEGDPVTAVVIHRFLGYGRSEDWLNDGDIVGVTFEYANGAALSWSHVNCTPLHKDPRVYKSRVELATGEYIVRVYWNDNPPAGRTKNNIGFETAGTDKRYVVINPEYGERELQIGRDQSEVGYFCNGRNEVFEAPSPGEDCIWKLQPRFVGVHVFDRPESGDLAYVFNGVIRRPIASFKDAWAKKEAVPFLKECAAAKVIEGMGTQYKTIEDDEREGITALASSAQKRMYTFQDKLTKDLVFSKEADQVLKLRLLLEKAEKKLAAKRDVVVKRLADHEYSVQMQFNDDRMECIKKSVKKRKEHASSVQRLLADPRLEESISGGKRVAICQEAKCCRKYEPNLVPMQRRCGFVIKDDEGKVVVKRCAGATATCGCQTLPCIKCRVPICDLHFAEHKRMCLRQPNDSGRYYDTQFYWRKEGEVDPWQRDSGEGF